MLMTVFDYVYDVANIETYRNMDAEARRKLIGRLTIGICCEYAPRRNYDISKEEIRELVTDSLDFLLAERSVKPE